MNKYKMINIQELKGFMFDYITRIKDEEIDHSFLSDNLLEFAQKIIEEINKDEFKEE